MRLHDGSLSRLSYRREEIRHNPGLLNLAAADDAAAHEEEAVYFRDTAVVVPASLTFERPRFFACLERTFVFCLAFSLPDSLGAIPRDRDCFSGYIVCG